MKKLSILIVFAAALLSACTTRLPAQSATLLGNTTLSANRTLTIPATAALTISADATISLPDDALEIADTSGLQTALDAKLESTAGTLTLGGGAVSGTLNLWNGGDDSPVTLRNNESNMLEFYDGAVGGSIKLLFPPAVSATFSGQNLSDNRYIYLPDGDGTLALISSTVTAATQLDTPRNINGVSFNGTADITVPAAGSTLTDTVTVAKGGTSRSTLTAGSLLTGNGTSAVNLIAPGTSGNVLTSNGTAWLSSAPSGGGNITINTTSPLTVNGNATATTSNATLAISAATTSTAGTVPTLGATGATVTGAPTRRQLLVAISNQFTYRVLGAWLGTAATSGTGTAYTSDSAGNARLTSGTGAGARAQTLSGAFQFGVWNGNYVVTDWGLPLIASGAISIDHTGTAASDTRIRAGIGKSGAALGQISARGLMVEVQWNGTAYEVFCAVHNGTTLNIQTTGITFARPRTVLWSVETNGTGNAVWYISAGGSGSPYNGQARTTATLTQTGAPTGTEQTARYPFIEINNGASGPAAVTVDFSPMVYAFGPF